MLLYTCRFAAVQIVRWRLKVEPVASTPIVRLVTPRSHSVSPHLTSRSVSCRSAALSTASLSTAQAHSRSRVRRVPVYSCFVELTTSASRPSLWQGPAQGLVHHRRRCADRGRRRRRCVPGLARDEHL